MNNAMCVVNIGLDNIAKLSIPFFRRYCNKYNIDLIIITEKKITVNNDLNPVYEKLQAFDILEEYDRIAIVDLDIFITHNAPNIFNAVPIGFVGGVYEDVAYININRFDKMRLDDRKTNMEAYIGNKWTYGYINCGVLVVDRHNRDLVRYDNIYEDSKNSGKFMEQNILNARLVMENIKKISIDPKYNYIKHWAKREFYSSLEAYFIHYAGTENYINSMALDFDMVYFGWIRNHNNDFKDTSYFKMKRSKQKRNHNIPIMVRHKCSSILAGDESIVAKNKMDALDLIASHYGGKIFLSNDLLGSFVDASHTVLFHDTENNYSVVELNYES